MGGPVFRVFGGYIKAQRRDDATTQSRDATTQRRKAIPLPEELVIRNPVRVLFCISLLLSGTAPAIRAQGPAESDKYVPPLSDLLGRRTSELRDLVERVNVDLRNLNRRWPVGYSNSHFHFLPRTRISVAPSAAVAFLM